MPATVTVFSARKIITMDPVLPEATHVAVRDGRILGVGSLEELAAYGEHKLDERFAGHVLMPGLVEGHSHVAEGAVWAHTYVGYRGRHDPDGRYWPGAGDHEAVIARLQAAEAAIEDPEVPLFAWGFDPIYFGGERMSVRQLDRVSLTRPVVILHSNAHLLNVNTVLLDRAGISRNTDVHGVLKDAHGEVTGELMEMAAHYMAWKIVGNPFFGPASVDVLRRFGESARNAGVTTATDLFAHFDDASLASYREAAADDAFPLRLLPAMNTLQMPTQEGIDTVKEAMRQGGGQGGDHADGGGGDGGADRLFFGLCKVMTDGSIQGYTARMRWPGYHDGSPNGLWNLEPEELTALVHAYHRAGLQLHIHTNGDEATELMLDALEAALVAAPRADHRHTLQHCQMADEAQFRRMGTLGLCANLFANHVYYWGDEHARLTMGPDRARRMDACRTALRHGIPLGIHSDAPVTPLAPLFTAWCAVNRLTLSGKVLGEAERIEVHEALHAITLGAAYTLRMDHLVGSLCTGKYADFAVLGDDPTAVDPAALKDVPVLGTVVGGRWFPAAEREAVPA